MRESAATVALSEIAANLGSVVSYAGISQLLYFDAKTDKVYALDAGWRSVDGVRLRGALGLRLHFDYWFVVY